MSVHLSAAHLRRFELEWTYVGDSEVLRTCLSIVSRCSSLEELEVWCDTPGEHSLVAESPCNACCSSTPMGIIIFEWQQGSCFVDSTDRNEYTTFICVAKPNVHKIWQNVI